MGAQALAPNWMMEPLVADGSRKVVYAALSGNLAIAITKFAAFGFTRSTAMLTEAIHSVVDTADQILLLIGQKRSERAPDETHPFGYGMEIYFWSFIVALLIFFVGGAVSIRQGIERILSPEPLVRPWINYLVLAASAVFEGGSFLVGYREYRRIVRGREVRGREIRLWEFVKISKDPNLFTTLLEDGAALTGLVIAALGVAGSSLLGLTWADGAASILIGLLLLCVAFVLANESRSLIAGEAAAPPIVQAVQAAARDDTRIEVVELSTLHLGPQAIMVEVAPRFRADLSAEDLKLTMTDLIARVRAADPRICSVFVRPLDGA